MELVKKMKPVSGQQDSEVPSSYQDEGKDEAMDTNDSTEEAIFEDLDKEKDKIREWWLQSEVEEAVKEEPKAEVFEAEAHKEEEAQKEIKPEELKLEEPKLEEPKLKEHEEVERREKLEGESLGEGDAFISSLREDLREEEEEEMNAVLRKVMEEMGTVGAEELLEFGRATLREITERLQ